MLSFSQIRQYIQLCQPCEQMYCPQLVERVNMEDRDEFEPETFHTLHEA
jgi:hypothetical protein